MSWQNVTRFSFCSGVKKCGTKLAHNFLFPKSSFRIRRPTVLGMFKDSAIILDAIRRSFLIKSAIATMSTSVRADFGRPPLSSSSTSSLPSRNREYHLKTKHIVCIYLYTHTVNKNNNIVFIDCMYI